MTGGGKRRGSRQTRPCTGAEEQQARRRCAAAGQGQRQAPECSAYCWARQEAEDRDWCGSNTGKACG